MAATLFTAPSFDPHRDRWFHDADWHRSNVRDEWVDTQQVAPSAGTVVTLNPERSGSRGQGVVDGLEVLPPLSIRRAWAILVVLGLATGILAGVSVAADEFPIEAPAAFFACLGVLVLMATLVTWGRTSAPDSRDDSISSKAFDG